jgi:neuropeptide S receptor 1
VQIPVGIYPDGEVKYKCASRGYTAWWQRKTYFTFLTIYILVVPAIIIISCYVNVARVVWRQGRSEVASNGEGVALRRTVRDARFLGRAKIKTIKVTFGNNFLKLLSKVYHSLAFQCSVNTHG